MFVCMVFERAAEGFDAGAAVFDMEVMSGEVGRLVSGAAEDTGGREPEAERGDEESTEDG